MADLSVFESARHGAEWGWALFLLALIVAIRIRSSWKTRGLSFPQVAAPPRAVDLASIPGVDLAYFGRQVERLQTLGFRHLLDYELPHLEVAAIRTIYS